MSSDTNQKIRWRAHHTVAATLVVLGVALFTFAGATAAATIERGAEDTIVATQVVATANGSYVLSDQGIVYSQGLNSSGQLGTGSIENSQEWQQVNFPSEQPVAVTKLSSFGDQVIALSSDGQLWTWGNSSSGALGSSRMNPAVQPLPLKISYSFAKLASGDDFVLALDEKGKLYVWGQNSHGQLGTGDTEPLAGPTALMADKSFIGISAGADYSFAVDSDGNLWAWGANESGQLGNGTKDSSLSPMQVSSNWSSVYASRFSNTVLAINRDGVLHSWGSNNNALLGNGRDWRAEQQAENKRVEDEKARIAAEDEARKAGEISAKQQQLLNEKLKEWESLHALWETNRAQWLKQNPQPKPEDFASSPGALLTPEQQKAYDDALEQWKVSESAWLQANGEPQRPQELSEQEKETIAAQVEETFQYTDTSNLVPAVIEEPPIGEESLTPVAIATATRFTAASPGSVNAFALDGEGHLWGWGSDENGGSGLGLDEKTHTHAPVKLSDAVYSSVATGPEWALAGSGSGVYTWGLNDSSNRLASEQKQLLSPTLVHGGEFSAVALSVSTGIASQPDGSSVSWGENIDGLAGQGSSDASVPINALEGRFSSLSFSSESVIALSSGAGNIYFWGNDRVGLSTTGDSAAVTLAPTQQTIAKFVDVAAGRFSSAAVDSNGFVWSWGLSWIGGIAPPASALTNPVKLPLQKKIERIAASQTNYLAVAQDNSVYWWGSNSPDTKITELIANDEQSLGEIDSVVGGKQHFLLLNGAGEVWNFSAAYGLAQPPGAAYQSLFKLVLPGQASAVAAGGESSVALVQGQAYGWGDNSHGQLVGLSESYYAEPTELSPPLYGNWKAMAISSTHGLALTESGALYGWGHSEYLSGFSSRTSTPVHLRLAQ